MHATINNHMVISFADYALVQIFYLHLIFACLALLYHWDMTNAPGLFLEVFPCFNFPPASSMSMLITDFAIGKFG